MEETKQKLSTTAVEVIQMKEKPAPVEENIEETRAKSGDMRTWNKKIIQEMQDMTRQLNAEKKLRRELEAWKHENEQKLEDMKSKAMKEVELRLRLEEAYQKLETELQQLKKK